MGSGKKSVQFVTRSVTDVLTGPHKYRKTHLAGLKRIRSSLRLRLSYEVKREQTVNIFIALRTVPTIVIAHTFCASRDNRIFLRGLKVCGESRP